MNLQLCRVSHRRSQLVVSTLCLVFSWRVTYYDELFQDYLGAFEDYEAKIEMDPGATPRYCKARTIPYVMRGAEQTSGRTLELVDYFDWVASIIAVLKSDCESVCIGVDFQMPVNLCPS